MYESVEFAKLKLLARALERAEVYDGGRLVVSYLLRDDFLEVGAVEPYSEGIIDYLRAVEGSDMAVLIREPPTRGGPKHRVSLRSRSDELDVSASLGRRAAAGTARPPASRASSRSRIIAFIREEFAARPQRGARCRPEASAERADPGRQGAGASSFAVVRDIRDADGGPHGPCGDLDPFANGLLSCCPARQLDWFHGSSDWRSAISTEIDLTAASIDRGPGR